jgi:hypothetical protein
MRLSIGFIAQIFDVLGFMVVARMKHKTEIGEIELQHSNRKNNPSTITTIKPIHVEPSTTTED